MRSRAVVAAILRLVGGGIVLLPTVSAFAQPAKIGEWGPVMKWPNVAIHAHLLPNGKVMFWGRREWAFMNPDFPDSDLDPHDCVPRLWDPANGTFTDLPKPGFNLFCSGHTFLADGRLLVVGGHLNDGRGEKFATVFDPETNSWHRAADMNNGRWYPTAVTLPDGDVLVSSGQVQANHRNTTQQVWDAEADQWRNMVEHNDIPLYPRMHVAPNGAVFLSGHLKLTQLLNTNAGGFWQPIGDYTGRQREDGCSAMYDVGRVLIVGGGLPPQDTAETIDLNQASPSWKPAGSMDVPRRHHNATLLPDGTVLVTGGTSGGGGPHPFNDLSKPVKTPELWDPASCTWTEMADESVPRLYHSTAILLRDARVLSAGGGEYRLQNGQENNNNDSRRDAQVFSPPYLFRGSRPEITSAPASVQYNQTFDVGTPTPDQIRRVSWIRLSSVTHSFNMNQRLNFLEFSIADTGLTVTAPSDSNVCPPGHYMLFLLNNLNVPSVAAMVQIQ